MPPSSSGSEKQPWVSERDDGVVTEESEDEVLVTMRRGGGGGTLRKRKAGSFLALGGHDLHAEAQVCLVLAWGVCCVFVFYLFSSFFFFTSPTLTFLLSQNQALFMIF